MRRLCLALVVCAACSDDAAPPDGGTLDFTGGYIDWDSTELAFMGIFEATVTEVGDASNTATTAPNGRSTLTLPAAAGEVTWEKADFLTARYTVEPDAVLGAYEFRGISAARAATFHQDLGLTYDAAAVLVEIEVRGYPSGDPVDGVTVSVEGGGDAWHRDAVEAWVAGGTTDGGELVIVPNTPAGDGALTLTVDTGGKTCHYPAELQVAAGEVAVTTVACED
jgi:hypothetical protein